MPCSVRWPVGRAGSDDRRRAGPRRHALRLRTLYHEVGYELGGVASVLQQRRDAARVALVAGLRATTPHSVWNCARAQARVGGERASSYLARISCCAAVNARASPRNAWPRTRSSWRYVARAASASDMPREFGPPARARAASAAQRRASLARARPRESGRFIRRGRLRAQAALSGGPSDGGGAEAGTASSRSAAPQCCVDCMRSGLGARMRRQRFARCAAHVPCC